MRFNGYSYFVQKLPLCCPFPRDAELYNSLHNPPARALQESGGSEKYANIAAKENRKREKGFKASLAAESGPKAKRAKREGLD